MSLTTDPNDPRLKEPHATHDTPGPQHPVYLVLSLEEIGKGYTRPFRDSYRHMGLKPRYQLVDLTPEQKKLFPDYVKYEKYPEDTPTHKTGRFWTQTELETEGCGTVTTMGYELSATYARNPKFYGSTYCVACRAHYPVAEFIWTKDGEQVGS